VSIRDLIAREYSIRTAITDNWGSCGCSTPYMIPIGYESIDGARFGAYDIPGIAFKCGRCASKRVVPTVEKDFFSWSSAFRSLGTSYMTALQRCNRRDNPCFGETKLASL